MAQEPLTAQQGLLRDLDHGFDAVMTIVRSHPSIRPSPDGSWHAFEVVSHLVGWHLSAAARIESIGLGEQPGHPGDGDALNAAFVAERAGLSRAQLERQLEESFGIMRKAVAAAPGSIFWRGNAGEEDSLAYFIAYENGPAHYAEHKHDLEARQ